jgi:hypothetical protein
MAAQKINLRQKDIARTLRKQQKLHQAKLKVQKFKKIGKY